MGWEQGWQELQPSRVVEVLSHPPQELRIRVSGWGSWVGKRESSEIGVLGQRERGCMREGIKPLFFFILWLLLSCSHFSYPGSFLSGAVKAMGTWNAFTEATPSESPPLSHRKGRHCSFPPFTGPSSLTDSLASPCPHPLQPAQGGCGPGRQETTQHLLA